jgi:hypothetical protein
VIALVPAAVAAVVTRPGRAAGAAMLPLLLLAVWRQWEPAAAAEVRPVVAAAAEVRPIVAAAAEVRPVAAAAAEVRPVAAAAAAEVRPVVAAA